MEHKYIQDSRAYEQLEEWMGGDVAIDSDSLNASLAAGAKTTEPIVIKIITLIGTGISLILFTLFLAITDLISESSFLLFMGSLLGIVGLLMGRKEWLKTVWIALGLASFLYGQVLLYLCVLEWGIAFENSMWILLFFNTIALFVVRQYLFVFVTVLLWFGVLLIHMFLSHLYFLPYLLSFSIYAFYYFWLETEALIVTQRNRFSIFYFPVREALLLLTLLLPYIWSVRYLLLGSEYLETSESVITVFYGNSVFFKGGVVVLFLFLIYKQLQSFLLSRRALILGMLLSLIVCMVLSIDTGILTALFCLVLAVSYEHKLGAVLSLLQLLWYVGLFYYNLQFDLLYKSIFLMATGGLLGLGYLVLTRNMQQDETKN